MRQVLADYLMFIDKLKKHQPFSFAHFNDGELSLMVQNKTCTISRGAQEYTPELRQKLIDTFLIDNPNFYRGLICPGCWDSRPVYDKAIQLLKGHSCGITQACVFHHCYLKYRHLFFDALKSYDKIVWMANEHFDLSKLCRALSLDVNHQRYIMVPGKNAFAQYEQYSSMNFRDGELVILLCGPLGRILAGEYFQKFPSTTFLCLGSYFDTILYGQSYGYHTSQGSCTQCYPD